MGQNPNFLQVPLSGRGQQRPNHQNRISDTSNTKFLPDEHDGSYMDGNYDVTFGVKKRESVKIQMGKY